jgi:predicted ribonuclease YlaK
VVPDTSGFLEGEYFTDLDWQGLAGAGTETVRLVIPVLVIEELDDHKRGRDRQRELAVSVLRRPWELGGSAPERVARIPGRDVTAEVFLDGPWHTRRSVNDDEIIQQALSAGEITGRKPLLAAADYSMLYKAAAAGLDVVLVPRPTATGQP